MLNIAGNLGNANQNYVKITLPTVDFQIGSYSWRTERDQRKEVATSDW